MLVELDRPVDLDNRPVPFSVGEQVDAHEGCARRPRGRQCERDCPRRRSHPAPHGSERDVRPPFPGPRHAADRAHGRGWRRPRSGGRNRTGERGPARELRERDTTARPAARETMVASDSASSQRSTPSPQLPKRGLTTTGGRSVETGLSPVSSRVRGCGRPFVRRSRAVRSLSWAASSDGAPFRTVTPRASRVPRAHNPSSTPSTVGSTSILPIAQSPGSSRSSASPGVSAHQAARPEPARTSASLVAVGLCATTAIRTVRIVTGRIGENNGLHHLVTKAQSDRRGQ